MTKNGVYFIHSLSVERLCFIVTALLVAKLFKILLHANQRTCDVTRLTESQNMAYRRKVHRIEILQG